MCQRSLGELANILQWSARQFSKNDLPNENLHTNTHTHLKLLHHTNKGALKFKVHSSGIYVEKTSKIKTKYLAIIKVWIDDVM